MPTHFDCDAHPDWRDERTNDKASSCSTVWRSCPPHSQIESIEELNRLQGLPHLEELLLVGNPVYNTYTDPQTLGSQWRIDVLKILPKLKKLDGVPVEPEEREAAQAATDSAAD